MKLSYQRKKERDNTIIIRKGNFTYYYMGLDHDACEFRMWLSYIDETVEQLYYDMFVPFQACRDVYTENSYEFANTVKVLEQACNMLDLNYPYTQAYYDRICQAGKFLT